jgi:DNA-binding transcriptional ArsR family regulator
MDCRNGATAEEEPMIEPELIPQVARRFKALGEPARLELLAVLQLGEHSVSELVERTGRGQPNVSQHLKEMVHAGLVAPRRQGNRIYYRITDPYVDRICDAVCKSIRCSGENGDPSQGQEPATRSSRKKGRR